MADAHVKLLRLVIHDGEGRAGGTPVVDAEEEDEDIEEDATSGTPAVVRYPIAAGGGGSGAETPMVGGRGPLRWPTMVGVVVLFSFRSVSGGGDGAWWEWTTSSSMLGSFSAARPTDASPSVAMVVVLRSDSGVGTSSSSSFWVVLSGGSSGVVVANGCGGGRGCDGRGERAADGPEAAMGVGGRRREGSTPSLVVVGSTGGVFSFLSVPSGEATGLEGWPWWGGRGDGVGSAIHWGGGGGGGEMAEPTPKAFKGDGREGGWWESCTTTPSSFSFLCSTCRRWRTR